MAPLLGCPPTLVAALGHGEHWCLLVLLAHAPGCCPRKMLQPQPRGPAGYVVFCGCLSGPLVINFRPWFPQGETTTTWLSRRRGAGTTCT